MGERKPDFFHKYTTGAWCDLFAKTGNSKATVQTVASRYTMEDYSFIGNKIKTDKRCSIGASFCYIIVIITIFLDNITLTEYNLY